MSDIVDVANKSIPNPTVKKNADLIEAVHWIAGGILPVESKYGAFTKAKIESLPPQDIERAKETLFSNLVNGELKSSGVYLTLKKDGVFGGLFDNDPFIWCTEEERKELTKIVPSLWDSRKTYWELGALILDDDIQETAENTLEAYQRGYVKIQINTDELIQLHKRLHNYSANSTLKEQKPLKKGKPKGVGEIDDSIALERIEKLIAEGCPAKKSCEVVAAELGISEKNRPATVDRWRRKCRKRSRGQ